jgi:manganese oxidase
VHDRRRGGQALRARRSGPRGRLAAGDPVDQLQFPTPQPQPGGQRQEYWIQARTMSWDIAPTGHDDWHNRKIPGPKTFTAFVYQPMQPGFAAPAGPPAIPGPTLRAEVGDVIVVHFRNAERKLAQAVTMHPHGVKYTPDYDGTYLGEHTRSAASSRLARSSPTRGSARRTPSASGLITTTGPTTRSIRSAGCSGR